MHSAESFVEDVASVCSDAVRVWRTIAMTETPDKVWLKKNILGERRV
jgi:hypothetical protein